MLNFIFSCTVIIIIIICKFALFTANSPPPPKDVHFFCSKNPGGALIWGEFFWKYSPLWKIFSKGFTAQKIYSRNLKIRERLNARFFLNVLNFVEKKSRFENPRGEKTPVFFPPRKNILTSITKISVTLNEVNLVKNILSCGVIHKVTFSHLTIYLCYM